jgi:light-harvesting complex I chlorophyll a/b binding protein 1
VLLIFFFDQKESSHKLKKAVTMKFIVTLSLLVSGASAFTPSSKVFKTPSALQAVPWAPDENAFAYGLPGAIAPFEEGFDPLNLAEKPYDTLLRFREAETMHGRVAMLAAVGMLVTEEPIEYHPLFEAYNKDIGPAIRHLDEVRATSPFFFEVLLLIIGTLELNRAKNGFAPPGEGVEFQDLQEGYFPGDVGFDPLGLKPADPAAFSEMSTKELQNGRLAMLGFMGMLVQELVNGKEIFVNLGLATDRFDPSSVPVQF